VALSDAYAATHGNHDQLHRSIAATFAPDPTMSVLETLKRDDPAAFERLSPIMRMSLGYWVQARDAYAAVEAAAADTDTERSERAHT
jgi:hypothetical protein